MLLHAKFAICILLVVSLLSFQKAFSSEPSDSNSTNFKVSHSLLQDSFEGSEPPAKRRVLDSTQSTMHEDIPFKIPSLPNEESRQKEEITQAYFVSGLSGAATIVSAQDPKCIGTLDFNIDKLFKKFELILKEDLEMAFPKLQDLFNKYEEHIKLNENKILSMSLGLNTLRQTILNLTLSCGFLEEFYNQAHGQYYIAAEKLKDQNPTIARELYKKQAILLERYLVQKRRPISIYVFRYYGDACLNIAACSIPSNSTKVYNFCERAVSCYDEFLEQLGRDATIQVYQEAVRFYLSAANCIRGFNLVKAYVLETKAYELEKMLQ